MLSGEGKSRLGEEKESRQGAESWAKVRRDSNRGRSGWKLTRIDTI